MIQAKLNGLASLDGGTVPSDGEIKACNSPLLKKSSEELAVDLWQIGDKLGLLRTSEKESVLASFMDWEYRDKDLMEEATSVTKVKEVDDDSNVDC